MWIYRKYFNKFSFGGVITTTKIRVQEKGKRKISKRNECVHCTEYNVDRKSGYNSLSHSMCPLSSWISFKFDQGDGRMEARIFRIFTGYRSQFRRSELFWRFGHGFAKYFSKKISWNRVHFYQMNACIFINELKI